MNPLVPSPIAQFMFALGAVAAVLWLVAIWTPAKNKAAHARSAAAVDTGGPSSARHCG
ncbi:MULTISPECIES: hypothetical protein [Kocuria]|uniref:Uncharacterized protein n=1 Tax=Kocuria salsicia TaxID=664639 RepID=A0ABV3KE40_9MICC|nr:MULTISPECIES: hypothetical protein [Kocuria]MBS6030942.1 hypothetical protein [Kocuria rhizophila]